MVSESQASGYSYGLSRRLLFFILVCSTGFTLLATGIQLYVEYEEDVTKVHENLTFIEQSYAPALTRSLYEVDEKQVELQLSGALQLEDIVYLEVVEVIAGEQYKLTVGDIQAPNIFFKIIPLINREMSEKPYSVGTLRVGATRDGIQRRLWEKALRILMINGIKTFMASLVIYWFINRLITRHIVTMAKYAESFSIEKLDLPLELGRRGHDDKQSLDELDSVVIAINDMRHRISDAIEETQKVEKEKELLTSRLHQAEKLRAVGELAGGIAHDFNNQLQGIVGNAELLRVEENCDETLTEYADDILSICKRSADLIANLMAFSRKNTHIMVKLNINDVVREVMSLLRLSLDTDIIIKEDLCHEPAFIKGDLAQVQSALLNLGLNAKDAIVSDGEITFSTKFIHLNEDEASQLTLIIPSGDYVLTTITDTGVGIEEEDQKRMFEPFFTTKELGKGTGMGLAAVYGTVISHNGSIVVRSEMNVGTSIDIYLPYQMDDVPEIERSEWLI